MARRRLEPFPQVPDIGGVLVTPNRGDQWFVDTQFGSDSNRGNSWRTALKTMAEVLSRCDTNDDIYFVGDVREELTGSNLKFGIRIIGAGGVHHADQPDSTANGGRGYPVGASAWRPPATPTTATPLIAVRGRGWQFINILFDCPVDAAAIKLVRNAESGDDEYDSSHARIINCRFDAGLVGIENSGGAGYVKVRGSDFRGLTESGGAGIKCTSTSVAIPLRWDIEDNRFVNNASHILSSMSYSTIRRNIFGRFTATLSIDIDDQPSSNQGEYNVITENYLSGTFGITAYPAGTNNEWAGNQNVGGVTSADPT